jgi:mRNA-degrading endonuclease RelE of RelBE toxin-antitoxin system
MSGSDKKSGCTVNTSKVDKDLQKLPEKIQLLAAMLFSEIEKAGHIRKNWANFGPLRKTKGIPEGSYHCHLKKGRPTYVACWSVDKKQKLVRIFYVGTHEKAPY